MNTSNNKVKVLSLSGRKVTLDLLDGYDVEALKEALKHQFNFYLDYVDEHSITDLQRKHYYALMGDFETYTGYPVSVADDYFKVKFMYEYMLDEFPSLKRGAMDKTMASLLLEYVITFFIQHGIPFRKQQFYLTTNNSKILYAMTMKRICWISGKRGEIHHATNLIGMGRNRKTHDHEKSTFMCLSREYHQEIHQIGYDQFCRDYNVKAIRLNIKDLRELGVA